MRAQQIHFFYSEYLAHFYAARPGLAGESYAQQLRTLVEDGFSGIHLFAPMWQEIGLDADLIIANCPPLQQQWAKENGLSCSGEFDLEALYTIALAQVSAFSPDALYIGHPIEFDSRFIRLLPKRPPVVTGWRAAKFAPEIDYSEFDIMFTHDHMLMPELTAAGAKRIELFHPGFPKSYAERYAQQERKDDLMFSGSWTGLHSERNELLEEVALAAQQDQAFQFGLYLFTPEESLTPACSTLQRGEVWGSALYQAIAASRMVLNATSNYQGGEAGNMRTFEATGLGSVLLTPAHPSVEHFFKIDQEVVTYDSSAELLEKIRYLTEHPEDCQAIGEAGQQRCFTDYSMRHQAEVLLVLFDDCLRGGLQQDPYLVLPASQQLAPTVYGLSPSSDQPQSQPQRQSQTVKPIAEQAAPVIDHDDPQFEAMVRAAPKEVQEKMLSLHTLYLLAKSICEEEFPGSFLVIGDNDGAAKALFEAMIHLYPTTSRTVIESSESNPDAMSTSEKVALVHFSATNDQVLTDFVGQWYGKLQPAGLMYAEEQVMLQKIQQHLQLPAVDPNGDFWLQKPCGAARS